MAGPPTGVTIEFAADGRCVVQAGVGPRVQAGAPAAAGPFRCALPYTSLGSGEIVLRVVLPAGSGPALDSFPRLGWYRDGDHVVGTATLPAAPAFVSLGRGGRADSPVSFGWNFYGFFVFAIAFIAAYFGWAAWMARRERHAAGR